ncbi:male sterility protein-domain-containing protein [Aspergillus caelatus]|uniref:Male sterility protein-domain-containing protein n=1 Tax=Aspergillus caelatus TaxID=61420 RepID=A0A5N7ACR7_9EURO|nr:male sterility protein-domain-containing protein [Aspergillus caelatus]KAE8367463.1 male sterility protein-domain-containing protein [Aspergillus caelatus]
MVTTAQSVARYRIVKSTSLGDSQIKLSGQRVELDEIAHALLQASKEKLTNAHVCVRGTGTDTSLVAFVVFSNDPLDEEVDRITYLKQLRQRVPLPQYMWLSIMISLEELPLNVNGKVDRKALDVIELPNSSVDDQVLVDLDEDEMTLLGMWEEVLPDTAAKGLKITKDTDLFEAGGNSLSLVRLQSFIKERLGVQVPLVELVESCSLEAMARRLWSNRLVSSSHFTWEGEATIGDAGRIVILTGASGFLKKQVLQGLVLSSTVSEVHCIAVRSQTSMEKLNAIGSPKIIVHTGDLTLPRLGLDIITARSLASRANIIVHNGAHVSFLKSYSSLKKANVGSTAEFVRLAKPRRIPIHFISSAGVAGFVPRNELPLREVSVAAYPPPRDSSAHGCQIAKWVSERLLEKANQQYGLDIVLHRPTGIVGEGAPGADILDDLLHYSRQLELAPDMDGWDGYLHLVDMEAVAQRMVALLASSNVSETGPGAVRVVHTCNAGAFSSP